VYLTEFVRNHLYRHLRGSVINICIKGSTAHVTKLSKKFPSCVERCCTFQCSHPTYNFSIFWVTFIPSTPSKLIPVRSNLTFYSNLPQGSWGASLVWVLNFIIFDASPNFGYFATFRFVKSEKKSLRYVNTHCLWLSACAPVRTGRNRVVSVATCYRLDGPGIESRWYAATVQTGPTVHPASYKMNAGLCRR